jgi:Na+/melibiose symporter-like transporter
MFCLSPSSSFSPINFLSCLGVFDPSEEDKDTMANFSLIFWLALCINVALTVRSSDFFKSRMNLAGTSGDEGVSEELKMKHIALLRKYLFVYLLATLSDWLQGPYVYALYSEYGFKQHEIAQLFVAGFGSSMIFGSFIGGMADWGGRKKFVMLFAVVYASSCITKRKFPDSFLVETIKVYGLYY